jgi:hypothetical protein
MLMTPEKQVPLTDYSEDGVDVSLTRWMLSLTPADRLQVLQANVNQILRNRELNARRVISRQYWAR